MAKLIDWANKQTNDGDELLASVIMDFFDCTGTYVTLQIASIIPLYICTDCSKF
jgi:hypothetical protein